MSKQMESVMHSAFSDDQLISQFLKGDMDCFGVLYSRYYPKVYAKCYSFARNGDDAFDMTQEILLKAVSNLGSFGGNSKFSTWLYSIATNYCITQAGKKSRKYHEDVKAAYELLDERMDEEDYRERLKWEALESNLDEYLDLLPEEERQLLELKYRKNFSVKDLQKEFDLSASAVKMRLHRARMKVSLLISLEEAA